MDANTKAINFIRIRGPVTPTQVAKELSLESYLASAVLSELISEKKLKISFLKVGSSPLYYLAGQEHLLENFSNYLNSKDRETFELLKEEKILEDKFQTPLLRVSLRNIKDFAKPLQVSVKGETEVYWKWHTLPPEDTERLIRQKLGMKTDKGLVPANNLKNNEPQPEKEESDDKKTIPEIEENSSKEKKLQQTRFETTEKSVILSKPSPEEAKEKKVEELQDEEESNTSEPEIKADTPFLKKLHQYFKSRDIEIVSQNPIKKNEAEFVIKMHCSVGVMDFFCKAKEKKKINDGELASAYVKGQNQNLPVLFCTTGEVTKKAQDMAGKEFRNMIIKKI